MLKRRLLYFGMATMAIVLAGAAGFLAITRSDPARKVVAGMAFEQVRAIFKAPGEYCSAEIVSEVDGSISKHLLRYGWRFGAKILIVEFTVRQDERGNSLPDRATGETDWDAIEEPTWLDYLRDWLGL